MPLINQTSRKQNKLLHLKFNTYIIRRMCESHIQMKTQKRLKHWGIFCIELWANVIDLIINFPTVIWIIYCSQRNNTDQCDWHHKNQRFYFHGNVSKSHSGCANPAGDTSTIFFSLYHFFWLGGRLNDSVSERPLW